MIPNKDLDSRESALRKIEEGEKIPLGIFYEVKKKPYFERALISKKEETVKQILSELV